MSAPTQSRDDDRGRPAARWRPDAIDTPARGLGTHRGRGLGPLWGRATSAKGSTGRGRPGKPRRHAGPIDGVTSPALPRALASRRRIDAGEVAGGPESAVDADREAASLEQRQAASTLATGQPVDRDELVDGRPSEHELTPEPARGLADIGQRGRRLAGDARLGQVVGQAEVVDELRDPGHDPCALSGNSRRNARQPADAGASIAPGTRKQSRPCSSAQDAVISAPLRAGASTTTVASASPLMIRLRRGNVPSARGDVRARARRRSRRPPPTIAAGQPSCAREDGRSHGRIR